MIYVHENNLKTKITKNYNGVGANIEEFYQNKYLEVRENLRSIDYSAGDEDSFRTAAELIGNYFKDLDEFSETHNIKSQSKFRSTFLEEISNYLFEDNEFIKENKLGIFNKGVFSGIKIIDDLNVNIIRKDVDFCIGKKVKIIIEETEYDLIIPIIAVEVKTYLDATMFGEVQHSSNLLKNATPNVKTFVLMETNQVGIDKIEHARHVKALDEMFVLRMSSSTPICHGVLQDYYEHVTHFVNKTTIKTNIETPGRLINVEE